MYGLYMNGRARCLAYLSMGGMHLFGASIPGIEANRAVNILNEEVAARIQLRWLLLRAM